ncbi:hypothetical protein P2318_16745 [Myxococcaceae bacterium GXIMD 01537]
MKPLHCIPLFLLLGACGAREEGIRLQLGLTLSAERGAQAGEGAARTFTNDRGERITLTRAYVTLGSVELLPCPTTSAWRWLRELSPIGTARAHSASSPLKLGVPNVGGLALAEGASRALGTLTPPPGAYCHAHLIFSPADPDAEGLPPNVDMTGRTVLLEGEFVPAGGGEARPFKIEGSGIAVADVRLEGVTLSAEASETSRVIALAYDRWLDGVSPDAKDAATAVVRNVADTASSR